MNYKNGGQNNRVKLDIKNIIIKIVCLCLFSSFSAAFVLPGDNEYLVLEEKQYRIIFDRQYLNSIASINRKINSQIKAMSEFKNRVLDERLTIILFSSKNQISNAFATILPSFTIGMYPTGVLGLNKISLPIWFEGVFEHELNHVFQMSHSSYSKIFRKIFNLPSFLFFYVYMPYPNAFLPRFVLEGDSVLKESLFSYGGRLYDGYARAFVYSQIKHYQDRIDEFTRQHLLKMRLQPHSGKEKYLHGGYFMAMLAETYSHKTLNTFFTVEKKTPSKKIRKQIKEASVEKKLSPLFAKHFSFKNIDLFLNDLVKVYFNHWLGEASLQRSSPLPVLFKSNVCLPFGGADDEVFFLTSDFVSVPVLRIFNKNTKKWTEKELDLPLGKVFKINELYYARSSQEVNPHVTHYSLFSEGLKSNKQFDSKYVEDLQNDKMLSIDSKNNLDGFKLYLNDKFYSNVHSNALFDKKGNIYFFKQKDKTRILYKNKTPLFSYQGYYGRLLDIEDDTIYFTGSSPYGSSVYQYRNGRMLRSLSSDTVIQAKKINDNKFLVCEITHYGYEYKIIPIKLSRDKPVLYEYKFNKRRPLYINNKQSISQNFSKSISKELSSDEFKTSETKRDRQVYSVGQNKSDNKITDLEYEKYSSLKNIRYKGLSFQGITAGVATTLTAGFLFSDDLHHSFIDLVYDVFLSSFEGGIGLHRVSLGYQNRVYPLEWQLRYQTVYSPFTGRTSSIDESVFHLRHTGYLLLNYPLFKKGRWFSSVSSLQAFSASENLKAIWRGQINWGYTQSFPYNYTSRKAFLLSIFADNRYNFNEKMNGFKLGGISHFVYHLGKEFYIFPSLSYVQSFYPEVNPAIISLFNLASFKSSDYNTDSSIFFHSSNPDISFFEGIESNDFAINDVFSVFFKSNYRAKNIGTMSLGFKKAFDISSLGIWWNRIVPLARVRWIVLENLLNFDSVELEDEINFDSGELDRNPPLNRVKRRITLADKYREEKKKIKAGKYTHWLEWTAGFESEFIILEHVQLIVGFSLGVRTPLKFWEYNSLKNDDDEKTDSGFIAGVGTDDIITQIYFKMPL